MKSLQLQLVINLWSLIICTNDKKLLNDEQSMFFRFYFIYLINEMDQKIDDYILIMTLYFDDIHL